MKDSTFLPKGAGALFFIQMFSTLSFSVLYSTLVLYATTWLHLSDKVATSITASFVAFNFALHLLGGYAGGRYFSYRSLFSFGMFSSVIGCSLIAIPTTYSLYWGLAFFLTGAGLNVTCVNCMLTQLFQPTDHRRETAFLWNYSGMNVGFFVGFSVSGYFQLIHGYHELFLLSSIGNLIALLLIFLRWKNLADINTTFKDLSRKSQRFANVKGLLIITTCIFALHSLLQNSHFSNQLIMTVGVAMMIALAFMALNYPLDARNKMFAYIILAITSLTFWTLYQLAPMGLMLFIERNVDRHFLGLLIAPQWVQNINTVVIILGGPILSFVFNRMRERGIRISIPFQFSCALIFIGVAFAILPLGIYFANSQGFVNFNWIILSFILQSIGELFISPIGYAMVGRLAPQRLQGVMMGTWLMITGVAATLSDHFSKMALGDSLSTNPLITNSSYSHTFSLLGWFSIAIGLLLATLLPLILKLTNEHANRFTKTAIAHV